MSVVFDMCCLFLKGDDGSKNSLLAEPRIKGGISASLISAVMM